MNPKRLEGQIAWISGGASGMGEATAQLFAEEGAKVAVVDVQAELGQKVVEGITANGGEAVFHECDVAREDAVHESIEKTVAHFGGLQIIVNCAGVVHVGELHEYSEEEWDHLMGVNVKSIFFSIKHGHPHLCKNQRSYMVNIGSVGSFIGQALTPAYITSKHAVLGLSRSIALDYAAEGAALQLRLPRNHRHADVALPPEHHARSRSHACEPSPPCTNRRRHHTDGHRQSGALPFV